MTKRYTERFLSETYDVPVFRPSLATQMAMKLRHAGDVSKSRPLGSGLTPEGLLATMHGKLGVPHSFLDDLVKQHGIRGTVPPVLVYRVCLVTCCLSERLDMNSLSVSVPSWACTLLKYVNSCPCTFKP